MESDEDATVWGVVYQINSSDEITLDRKEGFKGVGDKRNSYDREFEQVYRDGNSVNPLQVDVYIARKTSSHIPPSRKYKCLIVGGAQYWRLPDDYVASLERIEAKG